jgi:hypothetical protein
LLLEAESLKTIQRGLLGSSPLRLHGSRDGQAGGWTGYLVAAQRLYSLKLKPRGLSVSSPLRSDGSCDSHMGGRTSCLLAQVRLDNNSRKPRNLAKNRQSDSLK